MEDTIGRDEDRERWGNQTPSSAKAYYAQVLKAENAGAVTNLREMLTLTPALDHLARGRVVEAADLMAQRFKAVVVATNANYWKPVTFLALIPSAPDELIS